MELFQEGRRKGVRAHAIADVIGLCSRTLRRWGIGLAAHGFSQDGRKGSIRIVPHQFSERPVLLPLHGDGCVEQADHRSGGA